MKYLCVYLVFQSVNTQDSHKLNVMLYNVKMVAVSTVFSVYVTKSYLHNNLGWQKWQKGCHGGKFSISAVTICLNFFLI